MVSVSASVNLPLHHKVQRFSSGTSSPGWSWKKGRKTVVVWWCDVMSSRSWCCYGCKIFIICWFPFRVVKQFSKIQLSDFLSFLMNRIRLSFRKMCCVYVLICTTIPVSGQILADDIKRILPHPHWLVTFPRFSGGLCSRSQPESYWLYDSQAFTTGNGDVPASWLSRLSWSALIADCTPQWGLHWMRRSH